MTKNKIQRILAIVLVAAAVVMAVVGGIHLPKRDSETAVRTVEELRIRTLLDVTGDGLVETYVELARKEAMQVAKANGGTMAERRAAADKAEEETRAKNANTETDYSTIDVSALKPAVADYAAKMEIYYTLKADAEQAYIDAHIAEAEAKAEAERQAKIDAGQEVGEEQPVQVDMSGFKATEEMQAAQAEADEAFNAVGAALKEIYPALDDDALKTLKGTISSVVLQQGETFTDLYDRYMAAGSGDAVTAPTTAALIRYADDLL